MKATVLLLETFFILASGCLVYADDVFSGDAEIALQFTPADPSMADSQIEVSVVAQLDSITATGPVTPVLTGFSIPIGFDPAYVRLVSAVSGTASGYTSGGFESNREWMRAAWGQVNGEWVSDNFLIRGTRFDMGVLLKFLIDAGAGSAA